MHLPRSAGLACVLALTPLAGCTVDTNARTTLGGERSSLADENLLQTIELPALTDQTAGSLTASSETFVGIDRSSWNQTLFVVPAHEVRHGAFVGSKTLLAAESPRSDGIVPTPESALNYNRDASGWPQILEVPLIVYSFGKDFAAGTSRVVRYGPGGWHTSPRWGGDRVFGQQSQVLHSSDAASE